MATLVNTPADILYSIFDILYDIPGPGDSGRYNYEICRGSRLISLSNTCRYMRVHALPWIFREVYNWNRADGGLWPKSLWPYFVTGHIRDRSVRHPAPIPLPVELYGALPMMGALTKVTLRLGAPIPAEILGSLALAPHLTRLEIHQARFDGLSPPPVLSFPSLEILLICICGFNGVVRGPNIDHTTEMRTVSALLRNVAERLLELRISGDLLPSEFVSFRWPRLQKFAVTEHTPRPYIPIPDLVSQMPALRDLSVLFSADFTRPEGDIHPPFQLGTHGGGLLTNRSPCLNSVTLSNMEPADPIFGQLPSCLKSLHLLAMRDMYPPELRFPQNCREAALTPTTVFTALDHISRLQDLTELSLTVNDYATAQLIDGIASRFPRLRLLQLGHSIYAHGNIYLHDVRDETILEALQHLPLLTDLKISLDFRERVFHEGPQEQAARWLMQGLPRLRTVAFSWVQWRWWDLYGLEPVGWQEPWDRSVLLRPVRSRAFGGACAIGGGRLGL
ncbi:hypothetical protein FB451DRAFT_1246859 [Mycena latifolia]|nr:hypothetical protein FB451DRAFT_1246859 [Mycena latifolia]